MELEMWRGSGYVLQADRFRAPRHHTLAGTNRPPRYGSRPIRSGWASQEHVGPGLVVDRITFSSPPPAPTLPDIPQDSLSAFWTDHNVKCQPELMGRSARCSNGERLDRSRNLTTQDSLT